MGMAVWSESSADNEFYTTEPAQSCHGVMGGTDDMETRESQKILDKPIEPTRREQALIEFIRTQVQFGTVTIFVQDSQPIRIETGIRSVKLG